MNQITCPSCGQTKTETEFYRNLKTGGFHPVCKSCQKARRANAATSTTPRVRAQRGTYSGPQVVTAGVIEFIAETRLVNLFGAIIAGVEAGEHADNLMFLGPSGAGKTTAAEFLAAKMSLPFTKVDASAMTDPESWFGTREVVAVDGVSVTTYRPSSFVLAIQQAGVLLIDEVNRVRDEHRNILLPLLDGTHQVTNPLTGEVVVKHPGCIVIMSGNRGLQFTGIYAIDPALMTRAYVEKFSYLAPEQEASIVTKRFPGLDARVATTLVRLANDTRERSANDPDFIGISTREVLAAAKLIWRGIAPDDAVETAILNVASDEGGDESVSESIRKLWNGVKPMLRGEEPTQA